MSILYSRKKTADFDVVLILTSNIAADYIISIDHTIRDTPRLNRACVSQMYSCLDEYVRRSRGTEEGRFASLLLRLPALRSISLKSFEHLFFFHLVADANVAAYIRDALRNHAPPIDASAML